MPVSCFLADMAPLWRCEFHSGECTMMKNVGTIDRALRIIVGLALLAFAFGLIGKGSAYAWLGWIGIVPLLTAAIGNCPLYSILGLSTCPLNRG